MTNFVDANFNPVPSLSNLPSVSVSTNAAAQNGGIHFVVQEGSLPAVAGELTWEQLRAANFTGAAKETLLLPGGSVLVGCGEGLSTSSEVRDAAAAGAAATSKATEVSVFLPAEVEGLDVSELACAAAEGVLLTRYAYTPLKSDPKVVTLDSLTLVVSEAQQVQASSGAERATVLARTTNLARDLSNTPPRHLNAADFASVIERVAPQFGLQAEVYLPAQIEELQLGGLLGVNAGSTTEARLVKVSYQPEQASGHLALVGKGIMYDSGGLSLKPSDPMHALMKFDMSGAASVFASLTALQDLQVGTAVTGWLMCTDNMPSGSATKLGDVLTIRGGKTVEVKNTDAEGRLVLADGLVLATEEEPRADAIVDIATLTGAALMALGTRSAALFANSSALADQIESAAVSVDETVWELPLDSRYKDQLKSDVADYSNIGGRFGGAILAALFLQEFVDGRPWAHLDIAGTMNSEKNDLWRVTGSTGFGARLLAVFAQNFQSPEDV